MSGNMQTALHLERISNLYTHDPSLHSPDLYIRQTLSTGSCNQLCAPLVCEVPQCLHRRK